MDASGCLEENEKGVEKKKGGRKKRKRSKATSIRLFDAEAVLGSIFATLFSHRELFRSRKALAHPREFAPVGWTSRNAFVYATARLSSRFSSLSLSLSSSSSIYSSWEGTSFHASPWECGNTEHAEISSDERSFLAIFFQSRTFYKSVMTPWNICSSLVRPYLYVRSRIKNRLSPSSFTIRLKLEESIAISCMISFLARRTDIFPRDKSYV